MAPSRSDPHNKEEDQGRNHRPRNASPPRRDQGNDDSEVQSVIFSPDDATEMDAEPIQVIQPDFDPTAALNRAWLSTPSGTSSPPAADVIVSESTTFLSSSSSLPAFQLRESAALIESGLVYDPDGAIYDAGLSVLSFRASSFGDGAVENSNPSTPQPSSIASSSVHTMDSQLRQLTLEDFAEAKPRPDSLFCPYNMEWIVVLPASELMEDTELAIHHEALSGLEHPGFPVWTTSRASEISVRSQKKYIRSSVLEEGSVKRQAKVFEGPFRLHIDPFTKQTYFSATVPSSIPQGLLYRIRDDRRGNPPPGKSPADAVQDAFKVLIRIVANAARDDVRSLPLTSATIRQKLGYDENIKILFHSLGFHHHQLEDGSDAVKASPIDQDLTLRNLIEILVWFHHNKPSSDATLDTEKLGFTAHVERVMPGKFACAHFGWSHNFETTEYKSEMGLAPECKSALATLGSSEEANDSVVEFMYRANLLMHPYRVIELFSALDTVRQTQRSQSEHIEMLVAIERSQGNRFTFEEINRAYIALGIHPEDGISVNNTSIYTHYWELAQKLDQQGSEKFERAKELQEAIQTIARSRGDPEELQAAYLVPLPMSVAEACEVLGLPEEGVKTDDEGVLTSFQVHMMDDPSRQDLLQRALGVLAKDRKSDLLETYFDPREKEEEELGKSTLPAGLNNIGNTCYLNSVLQYFYALRPLRERVLQVSQSPDSPQPTMDSSRRVGGRMVTHNEIIRSQKFVRHLALLFEAMMTSPSLAVTPERELAYLALVSARAEEVDKLKSGIVGYEEEETMEGAEIEVASPVQSKQQSAVQTELPGDTPDRNETVLTDSAAVEVDQLPSKVIEGDAPMRGVNLATGPKDAAIVNTRSDDADAIPAETGSDTRKPSEIAPELEDSFRDTKREACKEDTTMDTDSADSENVALPSYSPPKSAPPPLPPRPTQKGADANSPGSNGARNQSSLMRFGAQQDVSECLDNVLFQIEVALGQRQGKREGNLTCREQAETEEGEILRLFTGRTQQKVEQVGFQEEEGDNNSVYPSPLTPTSPIANEQSKGERSQSTHVKNEIFTILPVEVREEGRDIYDSLDGFFAEETLVGADGRTVKRTVTLLDPPPILQLQLQRVQFDRVKGAYKSQAHLETGESIFMDRYLDFTPSTSEDASRAERLASKRKQARDIRASAAACRAKLEALKLQSDVPTTELLQEAAIRIKDLSALEPLELQQEDRAFEEELDYQAFADEELQSFLQSESKVLAVERQQLDATLETLKREGEALWDAERNVEYKLMSVFMHRGEASHGHYFLNQRRVPFPADGAGTKEWFKYNDSVVTETSSREVLQDQTGATPYLLCFVRKDIQESAEPVFETLKRPLEEMV